MKSFGIHFDSETNEARVGFAYDDDGLKLGVFICHVITETVKARKKFPSSTLSMCALTEEVGELAKALLDESSENVYKEAVQVATMAGRVCIEGDDTIQKWRDSKGLK